MNNKNKENNDLSTKNSTERSEKAIEAKKERLRKGRKSRALGETELSRKEKLFVENMTEIGSETFGQVKESALAAGYMETQHLERHCCRLMKNPNVLLAIEEASIKANDFLPENKDKTLLTLKHIQTQALKAKSFPTLTKLLDFQMKLLDLSASEKPETERQKKIKERMTTEELEIAELVARIRTDALSTPKERRLKELVG